MFPSRPAQLRVLTSNCRPGTGACLNQEPQDQGSEVGLLFETLASQGPLSHDQQKVTRVTIPAGMFSGSSVSQCSPHVKGNDVLFPAELMGSLPTPHPNSIG